MSVAASSSESFFLDDIAALWAAICGVGSQALRSASELIWAKGLPTAVRAVSSVAAAASLVSATASPIAW
jgi:hypothetical protein